jgi:glutathione peroxidase
MILALAVTSMMMSSTGPLDFKANDIDGKPIELSKFKGKVVMIVNVASKCGLTPQYGQLQALYEKNKEKGFVILGFPANEFGSQEPGTNEEIKEFCTSNYGVTFPMFSKIIVKGEGIHPLYDFLTSTETSKFPGEIRWNFTKFLVNRKGELVARFEPRVAPDSDEIISAIAKAIAED